MEGLLVRRIIEGTVIDHIPSGRALTVIRLLGLEHSGHTMAIVTNVDSMKLGKKDIVKVEGLFLDSRQTDRISLVAPTATINIVREGRVVVKKKVEPPQLIEGIISCPNPACITRKQGENSRSKLRLTSRRPLGYQCVYCGTIVEEGELPRLMEG